MDKPRYAKVCVSLLPPASAVVSVVMSYSVGSEGAGSHWEPGTSHSGTWSMT